MIKFAFKNEKKRASMTVYMFALLIIFLAFSSFAIDGAIVFTQRMKLQNATEITALNAASEFNYSQSATNAQKEAQVQSTATDVFDILKKDSLNPATMSVLVDVDNKKVLITTRMIARPFFLAALGITGINLEAKACAASVEKDVTSNYSGVNWLTPNAAYLSDILKKDVNLNDTAILLPLGEFASASYDTGLIMFNLIDTADDHPLSLGPGGFITMRLPAPIVDKPGQDLYIKEVGNALEGYMVFAGIDKNPKKPYAQKDNEGEGIYWKNITCSATTEKSDSSNLLGVYPIATDNLGVQNRVFGSAYFDISNSCTGGISMVKYIRIVDDNDESAFLTDTGSTYYKAKLYGEASSATAGADIDAVKVLNYVELKPSSGF